jgi:hypothetical protein
VISRLSLLLKNTFSLPSSAQTRAYRTSGSFGRSTKPTVRIFDASPDEQTRDARHGRAALNWAAKAKDASANGVPREASAVAG